MTRGQKAIVLIGMLLIFLMGIFPPYKAISLSGNGKYEQFIGYGLFFSAPDAVKRLEGNNKDKDHIEEVRLALAKANISIISLIDYKRLIAQITLCTLLTIGGVMLQYKKMKG